MIKTSDFMNLIQLKFKVQDSLENKGLKKPNIRHGAMEHIYQFMKDNKDMFWVQMEMSGFLLMRQ